LLRLTSLTKEFVSPNGTLRILDDVNLQLERGDAASIMGPSGSGKSTLLSILGALEPPTSGRVELDGVDVGALQGDKLAAFRNNKVGFVFQDHCLLPQCTVLENVLIPTLVAKGFYVDAAKRILEQVGLTGRLDHLPSQLSGGEKQRVAIARALIMDPQLLLCDEPTGNLDRRTTETVADLLVNLPGRKNMIVLLVTHSEWLASRVALRFELGDGKLITRSATP
jgi:lipoprotein-releasing system ATP-binding protein